VAAPRRVSPNPSPQCIAGTQGANEKALEDDNRETAHQGEGFGKEDSASDPEDDGDGGAPHSKRPRRESDAAPSNAVSQELENHEDEGEETLPVLRTETQPTEQNNSSKQDDTQDEPATMQEAER